MKTQTNFILENDEIKKLQEAMNVLEDIRDIAGDSRVGDILRKNIIITTYSFLKDVIEVLECLVDDNGEDFIAI